MADLERLAARMFCMGFTGLRASDEMRRLIHRGIGGAILFKRNFQDARQFADLCGELKQLADRPFLTCIDQEGGRVTRLGVPFSAIPPMRSIGERNDPELARRFAAHIGAELRAANIDMNLAPVLDVDTNPANPVIGDRSFGRSAELVAKVGVEWIVGLQSAGVAACGKHFPGHGDTAQDSHLDLPRLPHGMERLERIELPPFAAAIGAGVAAIMTAHVVFDAIDPHVPATMSRPALHGVLRERLGFQGVIISDDLEMKAIAGRFELEEVIVRGVNAGIDLFMICHTASVQNEAIDLLVRAVLRGKVMRETIESANDRLDRLFTRYVRPARTGPLPEFVPFDGIQNTSRDSVDPTEYLHKG